MQAHWRANRAAPGIALEAVNRTTQTFFVASLSLTVARTVDPFSSSCLVSSAQGWQPLSRQATLMCAGVAGTKQAGSVIARSWSHEAVSRQRPVPCQAVVRLTSKCHGQVFTCPDVARRPGHYCDVAHDHKALVVETLIK